ncbi:MAG TPA: hypothetical protein VM915_11215 [Verrucomicrobiae bacterium]|nr:hypothetical protein [Verrucomicrobiae bacterium]
MHLPHLAAVDPRVFKDITSALIANDTRDPTDTNDLVAAWPRSVHALAVAGALSLPQAIAPAPLSISAAN